MSRLKVDNVDAEMADMTDHKLTKSSKMIVDAPCTGTGVMSKRADLRWRRTVKIYMNWYKFSEIFYLMLLIQSKAPKHPLQWHQKHPTLMHSPPRR